MAAIAVVQTDGCRLKLSSSERNICMSEMMS